MPCSIRLRTDLPAVSARFFRLTATEDLKDGAYLSAAARMNNWEEKAALYAEYIDDNDTPDYSGDEVLRSGELVDLCARSSDGVVEWDAPEGEWCVMRFYMTSTGVKSRHGRKNLVGLETDGICMDSHEAGSQNWTPGFEKEFASRRGYSIMEYLPVMAGLVVDSSRHTTDSKLHFGHRILADADLYFICNHSKDSYSGGISVRSSYSNVYWWNPLDGSRVRLDSSPDGEYRSVSMELAPEESGFLVVSDVQIDGLETRVPDAAEKTVEIAGSWEIFFDPASGGCGTVSADELFDWSESEDPRIRYYSGTAVYSCTFDMDSVGPDPEVFLKFQKLGALKPASERSTYSTTEIYGKGDKPYASGIMGQLCLEVREKD